MRNQKFASLSGQKGYLMIVEVVLIVIVALVGGAVANVFYGVSFSTAAHAQSDQALYLAESGIEHAAHKLLEPTVANRSSCTTYNSTPLTNTLGSGGYSVSISDSTNAFWPAIFYGGRTFAPTSLSSAITASSSSIPVTSTTGYAPAGRIMIDKERIDYQGITSTSFTNITRGTDSTTAAAHISGTLVGQYQCNLISTAGVPSLASPQGKRTVNSSVQLQGAWAVGNYTTAGLTLLSYNDPISENTWNVAANAGSINIYGTYWLSNVDGWFVGTNYLEHWTSFTSTTPTPPVSVNYRSIYCNAANDCHAVGDVSTKQVLIDWNGTSWTRTAATGQNQANNLRGVNCDSSSDCWAVGDNSGGDIFYHWTGAAPWTGITETLSGYPYNSVFCNASNDCWAVGANASFARLTSGTAWTNNATGLTAVQYNSIYCNNTSDCWAVGNASGSTNIFAHWNGSAWSQNSSNPTPASNLNGVACFNTNDCWAVGAATIGGASEMFHWDGTSWTNNTSITGGTLPATTLNAIAVIGSNSTQPTTNWSETWD